MASRRRTHPIRARADSERREVTKPTAGIERFLQASAALQEVLPLEQQVAQVLEAAREILAVDRVHVWAVAPEADRLIHVASSGLSEVDKLSLGERMEIPLTEAGAMARAYRGKLSLVVDETHPLPPKSRLKPPYSAIKALRTKSFVIVPIVARGRSLGLLVADNKHRQSPLPADKLHLLPVFALHLATAVDNTSLLTELRTRDRTLAESIEQQTATSEILRVISQSQHDVQPVFDAIAANARKLCGAFNGVVYTFDGELIHVVATDGGRPEGLDELRRVYPMPPSRGASSGRAILGGAVAYIRDVREDPEFRLQSLTQAAGTPCVVAMPMLRNGKPIGAITVSGTEPGIFTERQIAVLQTFADQAVIAIENTRLFKELESRNRDLTESLEQQTATSAILRVISQSQRDVQPVFETIAANAIRLCEGTFAGVWTYDGELVHVGALTGFTEAGIEAVRQAFPSRPGRSGFANRAILTRAIVHIPNVDEDPEYGNRGIADAVGYRSVVFVPMLRSGDPIGAIGVSGPRPAMFSEHQVGMLQTFADQAVIAIENTRLFNELQTRNRDLTESLEQQTATSEILRVISQSQRDVQPVFETIATNARKLCDATFGGG